MTKSKNLQVKIDFDVDFQVIASKVYARQFQKQHFPCYLEIYWLKGFLHAIHSPKSIFANNSLLYGTL